ncbi:type VI secretion system-associated FHA domain protein TagH [Spartinivicinus ruber]|uniref:type VI secretion system-associated FHA domain protein TagH n=1 Tax=Spartinivicinus ruber TaxID=2683272 RepID=UPI0013D06E69|nr:type VI secretion system-associated FHA domain protein TagH [Spartinivicinus ruber]
MELLLLVVSAQKHEMGSEASRLFQTSGGTVGRSAGCDWVLPDKQRHLSGKHLSINYRDGAFYLTDTSTNGVFINGSVEPLGRENQYQLRHGDRLQLADFEMVVEVRDDAHRIPHNFDKTEFTGGDFGHPAAGFGQDNLIQSAVDQDRFDPVSAFGDEKPAESSSFGGFGGDDLLNGFGSGGSHDPYKGFLSDDGLQKDHDSVMDSYFEPPKPQESQWENFNASLDNPPPEQSSEESFESFSALDPDPYNLPQPAEGKPHEDILAGFGGATEQQKTEPPTDYFAGQPEPQSQEPADDFAAKKDSFPDFEEPQQPTFSEDFKQRPELEQAAPEEPIFPFDEQQSSSNDSFSGESFSAFDQFTTESFQEVPADIPDQDISAQPEPSSESTENGGFGLTMFGFVDKPETEEDPTEKSPFAEESFNSFEQKEPEMSFANQTPLEQLKPDIPQSSSFEVEPSASSVSEPPASSRPQQPAQPSHQEPVIRQYQNHNQPAAQSSPPPQPTVPQAPVKMDKAFLMLLDELGIDPDAVSPQQLQVLPRIIGQITRKTIGGLIQLLMSRANLKNEFRMSVTMIQTQENNPLKFCVNEEQAIKQMLVNPMIGYLDPVEAVEEALNDFQIHQLAVMSATRSALNYMLKRLDPERLEQKFEDSKSKGMVLGNKRARYWEAYKEFYQDILEEENVFQSLFGNEFANAYEKQVQAYLNGKKGG